MKEDNIVIMGVKVHPLRIGELHQEIEDIIYNDKHALVLNVNANCLNLAYKNAWMRDLLNTSDIVFCDGLGVKIGAKILGSNIPERITYADWMWQLSAFAESHQYTMYFLGAQPGIAEEAALKLQKRFPKLVIVGTHHGYFNKAPGSVENEAVIRDINSVKPNIIIIGFGMPVQERWLMENWNRVDANVALTGGAAFDYISGNLRRAPSWMTDNGLEWLGRVLIEPQRLWRRYIIGNPLFLWRIFLQRFGLIRL